MKKLLIILLIGILPTLVFSQSTTTDSKNWKHTGTNNFTKSLTIESQSLTGTKITNYDATVVEVNDTVTLQSAISLLPFIIPPKLTTTEINALSSITEGTFVYDSTLHVFKYWNGSTWITL